MPAESSEFAYLSAFELRDRWRSGDLTPSQVTASQLARIVDHDTTLGSFTTLGAESVGEQAAEADHAYSAGAPRPLEGIPIAVKDLLDTEGLRTTYGSSMFATHVPTADAEAVRKVKSAGAVVVGKTLTHEFGWGITCENNHHGTVRNPWDTTRICGGSSGGSAAALAAGEVPVAIGSDTGGSIRIPASFCGVVGLKPTWGRVSAAGAFPLAPSLDHIGAMARTPRDAALLHGIISRPELDGAGGWTAGELSSVMDRGVAGMTIATSPDLELIPLAPDIRSVIESVISVLRDAGARVIELPLASADRVYETFVTTQRAEAHHSHREAGLYPDRRSEYGEDVASRLDIASSVTLREYLAAQGMRAQIKEDFERLFTQADLLLTPVSPVAPPPIASETVDVGSGTLDLRLAVMSFTVPQDLTGLPACAVRGGFDSLGLPVGVQFTAPLWREDRALAAAEAVFASTSAIQSKRPSLSVKMVEVG